MTRNLGFGLRGDEFALFCLLGICGFVLLLLVLALRVESGQRSEDYDCSCSL